MKKIKYYKFYLLWFPILMTIDFVRRINGYVKLAIIMSIAVFLFISLFEHQELHGVGIWKIWKNLMK